MDAALQLAEDKVIIGDLSTLVVDLFLGFEGGDTWHREEPVEHAAEHHEVVGRVVDANSGDGGPGEEYRGYEGDTGK